MTEILTNQEQAISRVKEEITDMMYAVLTQLEKAKQALENLDDGIASEIRHLEKRINSTELRIDKDCENILALYSPVAMDLRLVLATLSINTQLERIGDHADAIADYILKEHISSPYKAETLKELKFDIMFDTAIDMVGDAIISFTNEDTASAREVFGKDTVLNKISKKVPTILTPLIQQNSEDIPKYLYLFSIIKKLERVGDLAKNIAEETIFYVDAKYVKHKKKKKLKKPDK
ncbi:MAG: phosphate signaling complex protein PhoU [Bacteroidia bacterium]|nr:phosphate signaling complex protein PhoU [Bacteroidia bacterium]